MLKTSVDTPYGSASENDSKDLVISGRVIITNPEVYYGIVVCMDLYFYSSLTRQGHTLFS